RSWGMRQGCFRPDAPWRRKLCRIFAGGIASSARIPAPMPRPLLLVPAVLALASLRAEVSRFPADRASGVNPDTHLVLTFPSAPALGRFGLIRIYDAA